VRDVDGRRAYLAIRPRGSERWQLPKGTVERGERPEDAALREVREEGGVEAEIAGAVEPITYFFRAGPKAYRKTVHFFAMRWLGGDTAHHDHEVEEARWVPVEEIELLTFPSEQTVVRQAVALLRQLES
jgi:8-oxo-dGTP diphosphatase